jgi:protein SHQ1
MITPSFSCTQNDRSVVVSVYCPAVRASEIEIHVSDTLLSLHVAPYFLRLNFPASIVEDDQSSAVYDLASGYLTLTLTKQNTGDTFPDLDLLGKLLAPPPQNTRRGPTIEVLGAQETPNEFLEGVPSFLRFRPVIGSYRCSCRERLDNPPDGAGYYAANPRDFHSKAIWVSQCLYRVLSARRDHRERSQRARRGRRDPNPPRSACAQGAARRFKMGPGALYVCRATLYQCSLLKSRRLLRADFADSEQIEELLAWTHPYLSSSADEVVFTEAENATMLRLPRRECTCTYRYPHSPNAHSPPKDIASPPETRALYLTLLTLLFSYAYDARTTQHDPTPESAWTIAVLTPTFSALDPPPYPTNANSVDDPPPSSSDINTRELAESLIPSYRRALAFPLYRSWALAEACRMDAARLLARGTRTVLRCLLELRAILDVHEVYYVYSRIWLDDFCRWIQACARCGSVIRVNYLFIYFLFQRGFFETTGGGRGSSQHVEGFTWLGSWGAGTRSAGRKGGRIGQ